MTRTTEDRKNLHMEMWSELAETGDRDKGRTNVMMHLYNIGDVPIHMCFMCEEFYDETTHCRECPFYEKDCDYENENGSGTPCLCNRTYYRQWVFENNLSKRKELALCIACMWEDRIMLLMNPKTGSIAPEEEWRADFETMDAEAWGADTFEGAGLIELKPCPTCGNTKLYHYDELRMVECRTCMKLYGIDEWQANRPLENGLRAERDRLQTLVFKMGKTIELLKADNAKLKANLKAAEEVISELTETDTI